MTNENRCPECDSADAALNRRDFVRRVGGTALAASAAPLLGSTAQAAPEAAKSTAETVVTEFYGTLTDAQKRVIAFPFEHKLRRRISANWHITKPTIGDDFYTNEQQALIEKIVQRATSEDGYERLLEQMDYDDGGIHAYSVAVFGQPGTNKFQFALTGRHLTLRADGDTNDNVAFGGPLVYGHAEEEVKDNLFYYQTQKANEVYKSLDGGQAWAALNPKAPKETAVQLQGKNGRFPGIRVGELSSDQKSLVEETLKVILAPYREQDVNEAMSIMRKSGGLDELRMAFYAQGDLNKDEEWDMWRIEGPSLVCHFRGAPHVHAYVNVAVKA